MDEFTEVTIHDIFNKCTLKAQGMFTFLGMKTEFPFMSDYITKYSIYDYWVDTIFRSKIMSTQYEEYTDYLDRNIRDLQLISASVINLNSYKYNKLYNTLSLDYNPIENYNRNEEHDETETPNQTKEVTGTYIDGQRSDVQTNENGVRKTIQTNVDKVAPFDTDTFKNSSSNDLEINVNASNDNNTFKKGEQNNTNNSTEKISGTNVKKVISNIHGNIGVMSTQDMIQQERNLAMFSFYKIVLSDIINVATLDIY